MKTFERLKDQLAEALERGGGTHTVDDVREALAAGTMQLWETDSAVCITEVVQYPRYKAARVFAGAGNMDSMWQTIEPAIARWARDLRCERIEAIGRMGWLKVAPKHGYEETRVYAWRWL